MSTNRLKSNQHNIIYSATLLLILISCNINRKIVKSSNINEMDNTYIAPVISTIDPSCKFLCHFYENNFYYTNIRSLKTKKIELQNEIRRFSFSQSGEFLVIATNENIIRYQYMNDWNSAGSVHYVQMAKICINNLGDVVIFSIPNATEQNCTISYWGIKYDSISTKKELGLIVPNIAYFSSAGSEVIFNGVYTNYNTDDKKGNIYFGKLKVDKENILSNELIVDESNVFQNGSFYYPFMNNSIFAYTNHPNLQIAILRDNLKLIKEVMPDQLKIESNIVKTAISPNNKKLAILWSSWNGQKDSFFVNLINTEDFSVNSIIGPDIETPYLESLGVSNDGQLYYATIEQQTMSIKLFKQKNDELDLIKTIQVKD